MRLLVQRVKRASVVVEEKCVGKIQKGVLLFLGVRLGDSIEDASFLAHKVATLRIFSDKEDKMNLSLFEIQGSALVISQFTLYADCLGGRRPSFTDAAPPQVAEEFYEKFILELKKEIPHVETGIFGAKMEIELVNDGPATFIVDSKKAC